MCRFAGGTVAREERSRGICVSVIDTGSGIEPVYAKQLFEPFFTTKSTKGTGLGLWISKGIIQKYGGTIRFRSLRHRSGNCTCFRVFLPNANRNAVPSTTDDARSAYAELTGRPSARE